MSIKKTIAVITLIIGSALSWPTEVKAIEFTQRTIHAALSVIPEYQEISAQQTHFSLLARIKLNPGWHIYRKNPGETGDPTLLSYSDSPYYQLQNQTYSTPQKKTFNELITTYIHHQQLFIKTDFNLQDLNEKKSIPFHLALSYSACQHECFPETMYLDFEIPLSVKATKNPSYLEPAIMAENTFPLPLESTAFIEGQHISLEIAPEILQQCQQPEFISSHLKKSILADLPRTTIQDKNHLRIEFDEGEVPENMQGVLLCNTHAYALNPIVKPLPLSSESAPTKGLFYYLLTAFIAGLILNLMPCVLPILSLKALYLAQHKEQTSPLSALVYLTGVLCSFMVLSGILFYLRGIGAELGWGFQLQSPAFNLFLLLLFVLIFLNLLDKLQIPATFADKLHKFAGNQSFLTGFFAVIVACPCTGPFMGAALGYAMRENALIYFGIFLSLGLGYALPYVLIEMFPHRFLNFIPKPGAWMITLKRILALPIALTCLWLGWIIFNQLRPIPHQQEILWQPYNPEEVSQAIEKNEPVFIDFTAKWCLICLLNDKTALSTETFKHLANQNKIRLFKADWTNHSQDITTALKAYGRNSIPLYVYYPPQHSTPQFLPQVLTTEILKQTFK